MLCEVKNNALAKNTLKIHTTTGWLIFCYSDTIMSEKSFPFMIEWQCRKILWKFK